MPSFYAANHLHTTLTDAIYTTLYVRLQHYYRGKDLIVDGWFHERGVLWPGQAMSLQVEQILEHRKSDYQDILVFKSTNHGNVLVLDGVIQVTERDEFAYQEMITHLPLFAHKNPQRVLVIGGGDGGVLREVVRHANVQEIVICELDQAVIDVSKQYLPTCAVGYKDQRVTVHVMDGFKFMHENPGSFDVIITDSSDPVGPATVLFETPFYKAMHAALKPGGIVCTQGECMWLHLDLIRPLIQSISILYQTVEYAYTTIPTYPSGQIGFIIATKASDGDDDGDGGTTGCKVPRRQPDKKMLEQLRYYTPELHQAAFVLPAFAKRSIFPENK
jgi:spermidine synthase